MTQREAQQGGETLEKTVTAERAIVRDVARSFDRCLQPNKDHEPIDVGLARRQHDTYCRALTDAGLRLNRLPADEQFPDSCFVEDPVTVVGSTLILNRLGAESRRGEEIGLAGVFPDHFERSSMPAPATLEGGDVLRIGDRIYTGISDRTNRAGISFLADIAKKHGCKVIAVELGDVLHLKSVISWLGGDCVVMARGDWDDSVFSGYKRIELMPEDAYAANCRPVNGRVLVADGYPAARAAIEAEGYETVVLDVSEFRKATGGLSCLSQVL